MVATDPPAFDAMEREKAIKYLQSLHPSVLDHISRLTRDFNRRSDDEVSEVETRELINELTFVYFLSTVSIRNGHRILRGRPVGPNELLASVSEFGPPPAGKTVTGRANGAGSPVFYGGSSDETVFAEIGAAAGSFVNIAAFTVKPDSEISAHVIGEIDYYRRWKRGRFLPEGMEGHTQEILSELHPDVALAVQLVDAFLVDRFSRPGKAAYRITNIIALEFLGSRSVDAIIYPSVAHAGGINYGIKADVSVERLEAGACAAVEILNDYGYGSFRGGRYGLATINGDCDRICWVTPKDHLDVIQKLKREADLAPNFATEWLMRTGTT